MTISYKTIGSNIKSARKALHLTQAQVAEMLGISQLHYGRLERGDRNVSFAQLARVSDILRVPFHALISGALMDSHGIKQQIQDTFSDIPKKDAALIGELYQLIRKYHA